MMVGVFDGASPIPILPLCRVLSRCNDAYSSSLGAWTWFQMLAQREESTAAKGVCEIFQRMPCVQAGGEERIVSKVRRRCAVVVCSILVLF